MFVWRVILLAVCVNPLVNCQEQPSDTKGFQQGMDLIHDTLANMRRFTRKLDYAARAQKSQTIIPTTTPFPCNLTEGRSAVRPSSVHRLRPGDIDVVGAIGDSIMAAFGAIALDIVSVLIPDRGRSFAGGGVETWRTAFTLPNVLKLYNPKLVGFSRGSGYSWNVDAQFNIAEALASTVDLVHQARLMVKRMKNDRRVDFENDWKMVTVMMGANDFCHWICYEDAEAAVDQHRKLMIEMLDYFRDNVPRVFVNLVPPPNLNRVYFGKLAATDWCYPINQVECGCLLGQQFHDKQPLFDAVMDAFQRVDKEIAERDEYMNKEDFAVVLQPFTVEATLPVDEHSTADNPMIDHTFFSVDCFHFSQKLQSVSANALWNNLMQPAGSKSRGWNLRLLEDLVCPSEERPYIYTEKNSDHTEQP